MANLLWLQGGACSGNTMSFLNADEPSACDLVTDFGINILWHPSLGMELGDNLQKMLRDCVSGAIPLDIFVFEGTVVNAPNGTGNWNRFAGRPMKQWVRDLSDAAQFVVAIGDCATWGGIPATAPNPIELAGSAIPETRAGRIPGRRLHLEGRSAGHQHPRLSGASRLDHADRRCGRDRTRRRRQPGRSAAAEDVLPELHADRLHAQHALRLQGLGDRVRPAQRLPVLRPGLPRPDDSLAVQPHPVEPAVVEDPLRHALPGLHRAGVSRSSIWRQARCSRRRP